MVAAIADHGKPHRMRQLRFICYKACMRWLLSALMNVDLASFTALPVAAASIEPANKLERHWPAVQTGRRCLRNLIRKRINSS